MGAWQGFWVTRLGVSSFIVTLAGMLYFRGISMILTNGATVAPLPPSPDRIATGFLPPAWSIAAVLARARRLRRPPRSPSSAAPRRSASPTGGCPSSPARCVPPAAHGGRRDLDRLLAGHALPRAARRHLHASPPSSSCAAPRYGAQLYAIGGNPEAARLAGIDIRRAIFWNFVIAGLGYGITGIALTARVSGAVGGSAGLFLELDAIAAAIIGGTALAGGRGRILGALLGALLMGSLNNGMSLMNVPTFYQDTARGIVLLLAVAIDQLSRRR